MIKKYQQLWCIPMLEIISGTRIMLSQSHSDKVEGHLEYLLEVLPEWIKSVKVSKGLFVKVDKKADLKSLVTRLERTKHSLEKLT